MSTLNLKSAILSRSIGRSHRVLLSGPVTLDSTYIPHDVAPFVESLGLTDTLLEPVRGTLFVESLGLTDTLTATKAVTRTITDSLSFRDSILAGFEHLSIESLALTDSLLAARSPSPLTESLVISDALTAEKSTTRLSNESLRVTDTLSTIRLVTITESLSLSDTLTGKISAFVTLTDSLSISDTSSATVASYRALNDSLILGDSLTADVARFVTLTESLGLNDRLITNPVQTILAINADTGAVSEYRFNIPLNSICAWKGQLYLATDTGIYALDGTDDDGTAIEWEMRTGFSNMGTDTLKRILDANVLARGEGDVLFMLTAARYGKKEERRYQLVKLTADDLRDQVIKAARGIQSVYWQTGIRGSGPAEIDELRLRIEPLSRRR